MTAPTRHELDLAADIANTYEREVRAYLANGGPTARDEITDEVREYVADWIDDIDPIFPLVVDVLVGRICRPAPFSATLATLTPNPLSPCDALAIAAVDLAYQVACPDDIDHPDWNLPDALDVLLETGHPCLVPAIVDAIRDVRAMWADQQPKGGM